MAVRSRERRSGPGSSIPLAGGAPPASLTDGDGRFSLSGVETGARLFLRAERDGFLPATLEVEPGAESDPDSILLTLKPCSPAASRRSAASPSRGLGSRWRSGRRPRAWWLPGPSRTPRPTRSPSRSAGPTPRGASAADQHDAFLDLEFATGYALAGVVTLGGNAVEGALVSVHGADSAGAVTGPQGRFRIGPLTPGPYQVVVLDRATGTSRSWTLNLDNDRETVFDLSASQGTQDTKP